MKKLMIALLSLSLVAGVSAEENKKETSFDVSLNTDPFFGFNILAGGAIPINDTFDFNVYGLFWTDVGAGIGNNPWTEFGAGTTWKAAPSFSATVLLGFLSGDLQSASGTASVGEALVPNVTLDYNDGMIEGQVYAGYYATMSGSRKNREDVSNYLHAWVNAGYIINDYFSAGVHFEQLEVMGTYLAGETSSNGETSNIYQWMGGYFETKFPDKNAALRFTGGIDMASGREHFYKMSLAMGL